MCLNVSEYHKVDVFFVVLKRQFNAIWLFGKSNHYSECLHSMCDLVKSHSKHMKEMRIKNGCDVCELLTIYALEPRAINLRTRHTLTLHLKWTLNIRTAASQRSGQRRIICGP